MRIKIHLPDDATHDEMFDLEAAMKAAGLKVELGVEGVILGNVRKADWRIVLNAPEGVVEVLDEMVTIKEEGLAR